MDIRFYCYFLFSCVPQQFRFYEADQMFGEHQMEKKDEEQEAADDNEASLGWKKSPMCNRRLLNERQRGKKERNFESI